MGKSLGLSSCELPNHRIVWVPPATKFLWGYGVTSTVVLRSNTSFSEHDHELRSRLFIFCLSETGHLAKMPENFTGGSYLDGRSQIKSTITVVFRTRDLSHGFSPFSAPPALIIHSCYTRITSVLRFNIKR